jgi:hypothetical protein
MGVSSIIAILVILVLAVFSALSLMTAKADLTLSKKTADSTIAYYEADAVAETVLHYAAKGETPPSATDIINFSTESTDEGRLLSFSVIIDDERNLDVRVLIAADGQYHRQLWQVVPSGEWTASDDIKLFQ